MKIVGVIPARYKSGRVPGKNFRLLNGSVYDSCFTAVRHQGFFRLNNTPLLNDTAAGSAPTPIFILSANLKRWMSIRKKI